MKRKRILACTLSATLLFGVGVVSADKQNSNVMTRGDFVQAIVQQMPIVSENPNIVLPTDLDENSRYAKSVKVLMERGVIQGYSDGTFKVEKPISKQEAEWLLARIWGVEFESVAQILRQEYGVEFDQVIDHTEGMELIKEIFTTDQAAYDLVMKSTEAQMNQDSYRSEITQNAVMEFKEPIPETQMKTMEMESNVTMDFHKKGGIHLQSVSKIASMLPDGPMEIKMEQYIVPDGMYIKMQNPETGEDHSSCIHRTNKNKSCQLPYGRAAFILYPILS